MKQESYEFISLFDVFKIGIGPSSSHTLGPWRAALHFLNYVNDLNGIDNIKYIEVELYGSLAKTGKGHGTDMAIMLGLSGEDPVSIASNEISRKIQIIKENNTISLSVCWYLKIGQ